MCKYCDGDCSCHINPPCSYCEAQGVAENQLITEYNGKTVKSIEYVRDRVLITFTDLSTITILAFDYKLSIVLK